MLSKTAFEFLPSDKLTEDHVKGENLKRVKKWP